MSSGSHRPQDIYAVRKKDSFYIKEQMILTRRLAEGLGEFIYSVCTWYICHLRLARYVTVSCRSGASLWEAITNNNNIGE